MTEDPPVQFDLGFVLSRIRRWVLLFLFLLILVSGIGVLVALTLPTVYRAEALLVVKLAGRRLAPLARPLAYGLGAVGAYWLADRVVSFWAPAATSGW